MSTIDYRCDYCNCDSVVHVYQPIGSERMASVGICECCGLVQSTFNTSSYKKNIQLTSGAAWGNIRYGKILALKGHLPYIDEYCRSVIQKKGNFLDIGSSRGAFVDYLCGIDQTVNITAIEPDPRILGEYIFKDNVDFHGEIFENCTNLGKFDFIYSSHTIEHVCSASSMLSLMRDVLNNDGMLLMACPNIDYIEDTVISEEFFLDKHKFHFSKILLQNMLSTNGFTVIADHSSTAEIIFLCKGDQRKTIITAPEQAVLEKKRIQRYSELLKFNRQKFRKYAETISHMAKDKQIIIWGTGRIFDALINIGGLRTEDITILVDSILPKFQKDVHGIPVHFPDDLVGFSAENTYIIVCSKLYFDEIKRIAKQMKFTNIFSYSELC